MDKQEKENLDQKLIEAAQNGDLVLVKSLLNQGADIHAQDDEALFWAGQKGNLEIVKYLVKKGADIHAENDYVLQIAAKNGHLAVVKYLVKKGADIQTDNDCALKWAAAEGHLEVIKYFLFDCKMKVKQETKEHLKEKNQHKTLELIEKRDLLFKLDKDIIQKDSIDNFSNKIKI